MVITLIRRRSGLTRTELARRAGIDRTTLSRWEHGGQAPTLGALTAVAQAAGQTLEVSLATFDDSLAPLVRDQLKLDPIDRLAARLPDQQWDACRNALEWVASRRWRVVLTGPVAGVLRGAPDRPRDGVVDLVPESMLRASDRLLSGGALPEEPDELGEVWTIPGGGLVRVVERPPGTRGFVDVARHADWIPFADAAGRQRRVRVADAEDLLRIADASWDPTGRSRRPGVAALVDVLRSG